MQRVRALLEKRRHREAEQAFVVEGVRLVEEALASGLLPELALYTSSLSARGLAALRTFQQRGVETVEVAPHLMETLAGTETPQGLLAVFPIPRPTLPRPLDFVLIADTIRDPGNLGTLLRSAAAAGAQAVLLSPGTADAYAPKVLRAGMGAHFRLPALALDWEGIRAACKHPPGAARPLRIFLAEAAQGADLWDQDLRQPLALVVGSEAEGPSPEAAALADQPIRIPMPGQSESLNAGVAGSILLFEVVRQRRVS
jgi:TrmH family RNA methyltransferase